MGTDIYRKGCVVAGNCKCSKSDPVGEDGDRRVLFYSCSGASDVAEASDQAARRLMDEGLGAMFCLAGLAADVEGMVERARRADVNVVIDGCDLGCARRIFQKLGLPNVMYVMVTELGIEKGAIGDRTTDDEVQRVVDHVKQVLVQM